MNSLIMCSAVALNIFSAPAGSTVVGEVPAYQRVYLMDGSLLRDWVFIGKPGENGVSPRGWVIFAGLVSVIQQPKEFVTSHECEID